MTVSQLRSDLQGSRERLFGLIRGLSEEQFRYAPEVAAWPIAAHLAHLLRTERLFVDRARLALTEHEPRIPSTRALNDDDPGLAQRLAVPQIIHGMQASRRELDELLARCDDAALLRVMVHERLGRLTVRDLAVKMAAHEGEHAEAIAQLLRQVPSGGRVIIPLTRRSIG
ncbi:MAG: DinB family protein [Chloroflexi bacterium]|nr:DinB family protein [Chloroflexota bacterium]